VALAGETIKASDFPPPDLVVFRPAGNTDTAASGTFATWITVGPVTVPAGFTVARLAVTVAGVYAITSSAALVLRVTVGGVAEQFDSAESGYDASLSPRIPRVWQDRVSGLVAGSQSVVVQYKRNTGTGFLRADTASLISVGFGWEP
jgi:hypothetical protein